MIKVGIIGATGYAGGELVRILTGHKEAEIKWYGSRSYIDKKYAVIGGIVEKLFDLTKKVGTKSIKAKTPEAEVFMDYCKLLLSFDTEMFVLGKLQLANSNETNTMFTINLMINPVFKELKKMFQDRHSAKID